MFDYERGYSYAKLCKLFAEHGNLATDGQDFFRRTDQMVRRIPAGELTLTLRNLISPETRLDMSPYQLNTIIELLRQAPELRIDTDVFNTGRIVFRNGLYSVADGLLHPFDGRYNWAIVNADYIENTCVQDAPVFEEFLCSSLEFRKDPAKAQLLLEVIGYLLSDYVAAKKAFFFIGAPSSGKSKILEFLQKLLGDDDVSQIPFSQLGSRFSQGLLRGKRLNVCTELPSNKFPSIETFKALTAGDRVYGELKGKDGFDFYPRVRLVGAGNSVPIPAYADGTTSVVDRMAFLFFNRSIPREEWNLDLVNDLLNERNVICSLAVKALQEVAIRNFEFTLPDDSKTFAASYRDALNPIEVFIREACEICAGAKVSSQQLWDCFIEFCANNNFPRGITQQLFAQKIEAKHGVQKRRVREKGKKITVFFGIKICDSSNALDVDADNNYEALVPDTKIRHAPTTVSGLQMILPRPPVRKGGLLGET